MAEREGWRDMAARQAGLLTRAQLRAAGVDRWAVAHRIETERWQAVGSPRVIATTTGPLSLAQRHWLGVLHAGPGALLGALTAAEHAGLKNWHRDVITVLTPYDAGRPPPLDGFAFVRTRRSLTDLAARGASPPRCRLEPALLLFAAAEPNRRTAQGALAAAVQQRRTTPDSLLRWLDELAPLRRTALLRSALHDMAGGAQSLAEIDVARLCRVRGLRQPDRQVARRDTSGRVRYTDCEWRLADGRTLVLEVDGVFHMDVDQWEDDIARQRALTSPDRVVVRCTSRELRDEPERVARDLSALGVPRVA